MAGGAAATARVHPPAVFPLSEAERWPFYGSDEIAAATAVLHSGRVNQWTGDRVRAFEALYSELLQGRQCVAVANGTVALELALRAFGIGHGDEVVVTPRSFVASASCVRLVGAVPVFADVDPESGNLTPDTIRSVLTPRTKAVIPVHLAGWPAEMSGIMELASSFGLIVIEDCAQAHGAEIDGRAVGTFGHAAAFSFCQDKIISTGGEGGLVAFADTEVFEWAWSYKDHGKNAAQIAEPGDQSGFRWLHDSIGTNWRMLEVSAAIGIQQLGKLAEWRGIRERNANIWARELTGLPGIRIPKPDSDVTHAYYKFYLYLEGEGQAIAARRAQIIRMSAERGLRVFSGSCSEIYLEKAFSDLSVPPLPVARRLGETSLMVEVHPTLDTRRLEDRAREFAHIVGTLCAEANP